MTPTAELLAVAAAMDDLGVGAATIDRHWRIVHANRTAEAITAAASGSLTGRDHWEAFPSAVGTVMEREYRQAVDTCRPALFQVYYPAPLEVWVEIRALPHEGGLRVYFTDVTAQVQARHDAAQARERLELVAGINADLLTTSDLPASIAGVVTALVPRLSDGAIISLIDTDGQRRDLATAHRDPHLAIALQHYARLRPHTVPTTAPLGQVMRTGKAVRSSAARIADALTPGPAQDSLRPLGDSWSLHLPIADAGTVLGALTLLFAADRAPHPVDELILTEIATRFGTVLGTARRVDNQAQLAEALQRSLLTAPPEPDHGQIVARYLPAAQAARVGGDWYDAFLQPSGTTMLVIGDVAGHDTAAAATMGQLRGLLRGIATYSDAGPAEVLRGLDASLEVLMITGLATATVLRFEQTEHERTQGVTRMVWASAGHPAPLVLHADGRIEQPGHRRGDLLLGIQPTLRTEHTTVLDRGATVLLYTDGLIEQRRSDLDTDTARLLTALAQRRADSLDDLLDGLLHDLVDDQPEDDIALIAIRLHDQHGPRPPEAGPQRIPDSVPDEPDTP
ncbi:SpoIIE family protein phosphatase [uncultured Modestobacter sp.]|uniref:SpoIIE family protein phosphatase n=1 Tax=uncultured Modestobacter sp. TaxID=380048 RepID=UPI00260D5548|nr:SpoIIE family protein phosphatase [uncultured Modestobacter sp.]